MQYNSVNDRLYCGGSLLSVIDCVSDTVVGTIPVAATTFAFDSSRNKLYAGSSGPLTGPGFLQETSAPGKHTFVLDAPSLAYRYLVVCTAADARHPTAATLIRLVEP